MDIMNEEWNKLYEAAKIHSESWKESHKAFCSKEFVEERINSEGDKENLYVLNKK